MTGLKHGLSFVSGVFVASTWWAAGVFGWKTDERDLTGLWALAGIATTILLVVIALWMVFHWDN